MPSFVGATFAKQSAAGALTGTAHASTVAGDILLAMMFNGAAASAPTGASGWTLLGSSAGGTGVGYRAVWKVAVGGDTLVANASCTGILITTLRGFSSIGTSAQGIKSVGSGTTFTYNSLATVATSSYLVGLGVAVDASASAQEIAAAPTGLTSETTFYDAASEQMAAANMTSSAWGSTSYSSNALTVPASLGGYTRIFELKAPNVVTLTAASGGFAISGKAATLDATLTRKLTAAAGAFTISGKAATLRHGHALSAALGTFAISGQAAAFDTIRVVGLAAGAGAFIVTGEDANLRATAQGTLAASKGTFLITGKDAILRAPSMKCNVGTFVIAGQDAHLGKSVSLPASAGAFDLEGIGANFTQGRRPPPGNPQFKAYPRLLATAKRLIAKFGEACVWSRPVVSTNTNEPWNSTLAGSSPSRTPVIIAWIPSTQRNVVAAITDISNFVGEGFFFGICRGDLGFTPQGGDQIIRSDGTVLDLQYGDVVAPDGRPIMWLLKCDG